MFLSERFLFVFRVLLAALLLVVGIATIGVPASAQEDFTWSAERKIPGYHAETNTPVLVTDHNGTIHAFSSQSLSEGDEDPFTGIFHSQWTADTGWTMPVDILLSPWKDDARISDAFLDDDNVMHVIFFGGDEAGANIYHAQAPAVQAARAPAWSVPVAVGNAANTPDLAAIATDGQGNLVVLYSGEMVGEGLYSLYSTDGGKTWTDPEPAFLTYSSRFPFILELYSDNSGAVHAVWDVRDRSGNGRQINYARLNAGEQQWSDPVLLESAESGYGVLIPTVVEHDGEVFVAYSGVNIRRSDDGGITWSEPVNPFRQTGVNGIMSFAVDSGENLHFLWAQRISGSPDIHGVWHSMWQDGRWTEPEAVVSGPPIHDDPTGKSSFDPYDVRSVVSLGNKLFVAWRQDPGLAGNGVWYSLLELESPELEPIPLAIPARVSEDVETLATPTAVPLAQEDTAQPVESSDLVLDFSEPDVSSSPVAPTVMGVAVVAIFLAASIIWKILTMTHRP